MGVLKGRRHSLDAEGYEQLKALKLHNDGRRATKRYPKVAKGKFKNLTLKQVHEKLHRARGARNFARRARGILRGARAETARVV